MTNGDVQFDEYRPPAGYSKAKDPTIVRFVIKYSGGLIKDEKQANYFLLVVIVVMTLLTVSILSSTFGSTRSSAPTQAETDAMNKAMQESIDAMKR